MAELCACERPSWPVTYKTNRQTHWDSRKTPAHRSLLLVDALHDRVTRSKFLKKVVWSVVHTDEGEETTGKEIVILLLFYFTLPSDRSA